MIQFLLFAWLFGQGVTSDAAADHIRTGLEARKQHQVDVEIAEFRKATELDPGLADAFVTGQDLTSLGVLPLLAVQPAASPVRIRPAASQVRIQPAASLLRPVPIVSQTVLNGTSLRQE